MNRRLYYIAHKAKGYHEMGYPIKGVLEPLDDEDKKEVRRFLKTKHKIEVEN